MQNELSGEFTRSSSGIGETSFPADFKIDTMLSGFFGTVSRRAFGAADKQVSSLDAKFKRLRTVARSSFETMHRGANRAVDAVEKLGRGLREQDTQIKGLRQSARAGYEVLRSGVSRAAGGVDKLNQKLREQADRIRNMPRFRQPTAAPAGQPRDPNSGRFLPGGRGGGGGSGGGGSRFRFGGTSAGGFYAGGFGSLGGLTTLGAAFGLGSAARGFGSFDANITTLQAEAGLDAAQRKAVTGQILDIAGSTQFNTDEVSSTLIAMVKDGIALNDALEQVPNVLKLAVAESTDLGSAWVALRGFVQSTNSSWEESGRFMDYMSNATSLSAAKLSDLQDIAARGLTAHTTLDAFSTEGFLAIAGELKSLNISNEVIGTGLRQFGTTIARATEGGLNSKAMAVLEARGIQFERGMTEVEALRELQAGVEGMADSELKNFFHEVFGERAKKVFENIIPKVDELESKMEAIRKKGTVEMKFEIHSESLSNQFKLLTSAGDSLIKKFMMILNESNAFGDGIGWVTGKITQLTGFMEANTGAIQSWWGNFQEVMGGLFNLASMGIEKAVEWWGSLSAGGQTLVALGAVILTFVANPVAGLIAAGVLIIAKWQEIKSFFTTLWDGMDEPVSGFVTSVQEKTMGVINWVRGQWDEMSPYFKTLWDGISAVAGVAWEAIQFGASQTWDSIQVVWGPVSAFFRVLWEGIQLIVTLAWEAIKATIKGAVITIEGIWNGLKAVFNWSPVVFVRGQFMKLVTYFRDELLPQLKAPFETFMGFITVLFNKIADGIAKIRSFFSRDSEGKMRFSVEVDEPEPLKVALPKPMTSQATAPIPAAVETPQAAASETPEYHETQAVKTAAVSGSMKPTAGFQAALEKAEKAAKAADRRAISILGKPEKRSVRALGEKQDEREGNFGGRSPTPVRARQQDQRLFGVDRRTIAERAHTSEMRQAPDLSRVKLFERLESEFPRIFERFFGEDKTKRFRRADGQMTSPAIPETVLSGDEVDFQAWTQQLMRRMARNAVRKERPSTQSALGGLDRGGITADLLMNQEREQERALKGLEATRVVRFPKLDDEQYQDLSDMFRSGFLSLVDVNSAILSEMQTQTRLLGGKVTTGAVIRQQEESAFDDAIAKRLRETQEMLGTPIVTSEMETLKHLSGETVFGPPVPVSMSPHVEVEPPEMAAPHVPVITPEIDTALDLLLQAIHRSGSDASEGGRLTPTGQHVAVESAAIGSGTGNITIEKIEIHANSERSAREIAQAVMAEFERMQRERNF